MGFLTTKFATCPQCGEKITVFHHIRKCSLTGELCCTRCIISGRFSPKMAPKVPDEYREKFRAFDLLPLLLVLGAIYWLLASAWPSFIGWDTTGDLTNIITDAISTFGIWVFVFLILYPISAVLPHLGSWMWYWWIEIPSHREEVDRAIERKRKGSYESDNTLYNAKLKVQNFIKTTLIKGNALFYFSMVLDVAMVVLFFVIKSDNNYASTPFSAGAGVILAVNIVLSVSIVWIASAFYCKKSRDNFKQRIVLEGLSWSYVFLIPLSSLPYVLGEIAMMEITDELPGELAQPLRVLQIVCFVLLNATSFGMSYYLSTLKPNFDWKKNDLNKAQPILSKSPVFRWLKGFLKPLLILTLLIGLVVVFGLAHELLLVDLAMLFCVASYYFAAAYFVLIFALLKLVKRRERDYFKYRSKYWTIVKISALILIINMLPTMMTVTQTNPDMENQFEEVFGANWENKIDAEELARLPKVSYSIFDQYYGYDISINAKYEQVYMTDSPRFVTDRETGELLSNGSKKFTNITHDMIFDAYLPAEGDLRVEFDDSNTANVKYPVVVFVHGIGMDRGSGNANWTSQYIANLGYTVFDMSYGFTGMADYPYTGGKEKGYDYPDMVKQLGNFTKFLSRPEIADAYHADISNTYFAGRSFGGWLCMNLAWLYNTSFAGGNFSTTLHVKGAIPYYPATDIPGIGSEAWNIGEYLGAVDENAPYIRGSSDPEDPDYNPEWKWYNALWQAENSKPGTLAPVLGFQGTHDYLVPQAAMKRLEVYCENNGHKIIAGYYPFGSHGFDAVHFSHYGQSILYYFSRFLALTS